MQVYVVLAYKHQLTDLMSTFECNLLCRIYSELYQNTAVMLQILLKEMSYFSYKPLVFFLHIRWPSPVTLLTFVPTFAFVLIFLFDGNER